MMSSFRKNALVLALVGSASLNGAHAAFTSTPQSSSRVSTGTIAGTSASSASFKTALDMSSKNLDDLTTDIFQKYGEESRAYRRTVYTHDDWVRHRSSDRFVRNLSSFAGSGIYKSLFKEVVTTTTIASFIVVWNMIFGEYQDLMSITHNGILHDSIIPVLALPLAPFTLSSPSLGLLLGKSTQICLVLRMIRPLSYSSLLL